MRPSACFSMGAVSTPSHQLSPISMIPTLSSMAINRIPSARLQSFWPSADLASLEIVEYLEGANEQADIDRIVLAQVFPDCGNPAFTRLNFHCVFQIEDRIEFSIYRHVKQCGVKIMKQTIEDRIIKKMVPRS